MGFNLGKIFRTVVNPLVGRPTPAAQSAAYQAQGMQAANTAATNYNNQVAETQAAQSQQAAANQQQAMIQKQQSDTLMAQDDALRQSARQASLGSTANTLYGTKYKRSDETTSSVLLGM